MTKAGSSARERSERMGARRVAALRSRWPIVVLAVALAFLFGFYLPTLSVAVLSAFLKGLASGSEGLDVEIPTVFSLGIGGILASWAAVALVSPTQSEQAWRKGAAGERRVGRVLDSLQASGISTLHDRKLPGSAANVDHVVIAPTGVFTIETKSYTGTLEVRAHGTQIWVSGRNRSSVLDQARRQAHVVEALLAGTGIDIPIHPVLCFVDTSLPIFSPKQVGGVAICTVNSLARRIRKFPNPPLSTEAMRSVFETLDLRLP
jgi:hypothetical protein